MKTYVAEVTREGREWLGEVPGLSGAHAFAATLTALRQELRHAIVLSDDLDDDAEVDVQLTIADPALAPVQAALALSIERSYLAELTNRITAQTADAARELTRAGWSVRDVAGALDITAGRVSQLAGPTATRARTAKASSSATAPAVKPRASARSKRI